jgi:thiol-disulfide isomerase/thioredoxin
VDRREVYFRISTLESLVRKFIYLAILTLPLVLLAVACQPERSSTGSGANSAPPVKPIPVAVAEIDADGLDAIVKQNKGQVVLVDFWATWCPPCRATFPHFVDLHKKYAEKGLLCVSVSMNKLWQNVPYDKDQVFGFLAEKNATFPNFIATGDEEKIHTRFGSINGIPYKVLFTRVGNRVNISEWSDAAIVRKIESELGK